MIVIARTVVARFRSTFQIIASTRACFDAVHPSVDHNVDPGVEGFLQAGEMV
jgi:hypothetical protein